MAFRWIVPMCPSNGFGTVKMVSIRRGSGPAEPKAAEPVEPLTRGRDQSGPLIARRPAVLRILDPELATLHGETIKQSRESLRPVDAMPRREDRVAADRDREEHQAAWLEKRPQARHR